MSGRNLILLVFFAALVLILQFRPSADVDTFWQLKLGQLTIQRASLIRSDPFTATHAGDPVAPIGWLSQVCYALLYAAGSWRLLHQVNALVFAGAFLIAGMTASRGDAPTPIGLRGVLPGMCTGMMIAMPFCEIRPHSFALLGFALLLWLAQAEMRAWLKLALAFMVLVVWQNMHPSVMLGAVAVGALAGAGWLRWLWDRRAAKPWLLTALMLLAIFSTAATPMGMTIFESSAYNAEISRRLGVSEWMPLWHPAAWLGGARGVWIALAVSLLLWVRARRQVRAEDVALLLVLGAASLSVYRLSLFFAVAMVPVWSRWIEAAFFADRPATAQAAAVAPWLAAGVVAAGLLVALGTPRLFDMRLFSRELPLAGVQRLRQLGVRGVIYNCREWGGPLIWAGYPQWQVTIDGRLYLFTLDEWRRYSAVAAGRVTVAEVERQYRPDAFFLRPSYDRRFIALLQGNRHWVQAYADENAVIFLPRHRPTEKGGLAPWRKLF